MAAWLHIQGEISNPFRASHNINNINGDHDSQVQVWPAIENENSILATKAILWASKGGHILGGCKVPAFKAMYIARHNQALCLILESIAKGHHGGF